MARPAGEGKINPYLTMPGLLLLPWLFLEAIRIANGADLSWTGGLGRLGFTLAILLAAWACKPSIKGSGTGIFPWYSLALPGLVILLTGLYWTWNITWAAWILLAALYAFLLVITEIAPGKLRWLSVGILALVAGILPVAASQVETGFSEEEFYFALQAALLAVYWLLLFLAWRKVFPKAPDKPSPVGFTLPWVAVALGAGALATGGLYLTVRAYQSSFFPPDAPLYPGISESEPFLCGQVETTEQVYQGNEIYHGLLEQVKQKALKEAPDNALLALGTQDASFVKAYKEGLLDEARSGAFAQPAQSIKYGQYQAALRIYFYSQVRGTYPDLFSSQEEELLHNWFAAINQRAQTVGWVDWMYALAFRMMPNGPYENQETGAGLLALLEYTGLGDASLAGENQAYLAASAGGWQAGFRNTDDAIIYQPEWINNAYFQMLSTGVFAAENAQRSFDWLLLQSPPDGSPLSYNHIGLVHLAAPAYLGAQLLQDEELLWLAGRSLDYLQANNLPISAQPGMEQTIDMEGRSPDTGSCLIYGGSGLPTQTGPLAPDKIVFRDGWDSSASYLLLNLRFTGWHRYKATNAIVLVSQSGPLIEEETTGETLAWLPSGRSLFRDKRIPRENLNGFLIERKGLSAVIAELSGVGSFWAQDPPPYARVERFETLPGYDVSSTVIDDRHGWTHQRGIHFYHQGPVVVIDSAMGPASDQSALVWQTTSNQAFAGNRLVIREGADPAEMVLLPLQAGHFTSTFSGKDGNSGLRVEYQPEEKGNLGLATVFLTGEWVHAQVDLVEEDGMRLVKIATPQREILVPVEEPGDE